MNDLPLKANLNLKLELNSNDKYKNLLKKSGVKNFASENHLMKNPKINYAV